MISDFLASRIEWLAGLPELQPGWISSGADSAGMVPGGEVVKCAISLLTLLNEGGFNLDAENLVMGLIPAGGVGLEIKTPAGNSTCQLFNFGMAEIAFAWMGDDWAEQALPVKEAVAIFADTLLAETKRVEN